MSNAYALRSNRPDLRAIRRRAALTLVRPGRQRAAKVPFVVVVGLMLLAGMVSLLLFNTSMQNVAFAQNTLKQEATNLAARQQSLELQLSALNDPQQLAAKAKGMGMVIPQTVAMIKIPSGTVIGTPTPADRSVTPKLFVPNPKPSFGR